ncbi:MAG TPA: type II toxin-antitoxin system RelE/ParE family toxin [Candidatus Kapabacteria bacterium]|nr:type II toxin-antitoxin system RelE/ParE family toxin [Candidatus Kapabacteria bacterium]
MTLVYHPAAVEEYEEAVDFYAEISPQLAARFIAEIQSRIALIKESPERWKRLRGEVRAMQARVFPFQVLYRTKEDRITVVAIMHEKRKPGYWVSRLM